MGPRIRTRHRMDRTMLQLTDKAQARQADRQGSVQGTGVRLAISETGSAQGTGHRAQGTRRTPDKASHVLVAFVASRG